MVEPTRLQGPALTAGFVPVVPAVHPLRHPVVPPAVQGNLEIVGRGLGRSLRGEDPPRPVAEGVDQHQVVRAQPAPLEHGLHVGPELGEPAELQRRPGHQGASVGAGSSACNLGGSGSNAAGSDRYPLNGFSSWEMCHPSAYRWSMVAVSGSTGRTSTRPSSATGLSEISPTRISSGIL